MDKISSTAALLDDLHRTIPVGRDRINDGKTEKAENVRLFGQIFRHLPEYIKSQHSTVSEPEAESLEEIIQQARSQKEMIFRLSKQTRDILETACMEYLGHLHYQEIPKEMREKFTRLKTLFKKRLHKIRPYIVSNSETEERRELNILQMLILGGIVNVGHVSWSYFNVIPDVLKENQRNGEVQPEPEDCFDVAQSVQAIIMNLVSCQDDVFHAVDHLMRRKRIVTDGKMTTSQNHEPGFYWEPYHQEDFRMEKGKLELSPTLIESARDELTSQFRNGDIHLDEPRVGCGGIVLIPAIHQWCLRAAKQCLFPHIEHIKSLPIEIQDPPLDITPRSLQKKQDPKKLIVTEQYRQSFKNN